MIQLVSKPLVDNPKDKTDRLWGRPAERDATAALNMAVASWPTSFMARPSVDGTSLHKCEYAHDGRTRSPCHAKNDSDDVLQKCLTLDRGNFQ